MYIPKIFEQDSELFVKPLMNANLPWMMNFMNNRGGFRNIIERLSVVFR